MADGHQADLIPSFPAVTWPVQTNMLTGTTPDRHGIIANGFFWREQRKVEMWTAGNDRILKPQVWDRLHAYDERITSAVWFPMLGKNCGADYFCVPAPIHHADGSESLWCATRPDSLYPELVEQFDHFPLQHFWGPLANLRSSRWIVDSAVVTAARYRPEFFLIYLPHLDYAAQREGPNSEAAERACRELDEEIGRLLDGFRDAYGDRTPIWLVASEYAIVPVDHVTFPNRLLRQAGLLQVRPSDAGEHLDFEASSAWALVDHQFAHVFVEHQADLARVADLFRNIEGIDEVLVGQQRGRYHLDHPRSGEIILVAQPNSWMAYYWWLDDRLAPPFARTVDIHRKPGYDPVELHWDPTTHSIPLDASRVRGSHGAPARDAAQRGVILISEPGLLDGPQVSDTDLCRIVLRGLGLPQ
jgi:predicted AlkP superfamily pyrophosphatase or phosphodiesterase